MKKIKAKKNFTLNGKKYLKDDVINISNFIEIIRLNERGFIYPLARKDIQELKNNINSNNTKKEDDKNGKSI